MEQSDLELLDGDFASINKDIISQPSLPKETTRKLPRKPENKSSDVAAEQDPFEMLMNTRPVRGSRNSNNVSEHKKTAVEPPKEDLFDTLMKSDSKSEPSQQSRFTRRRNRRDPEISEETPEVAASLPAVEVGQISDASY